jgi:cob(I)alamin adenosyltransferase
MYAMPTSMPFLAASARKIDVAIERDVRRFSSSIVISAAVRLSLSSTCAAVDVAAVARRAERRNFHFASSPSRRRCAP